MPPHSFAKREGNTVDPQAILPQPPPSLPAWAKILYYLVETAIVGYTASQYDYGAQINHVGGNATDPTEGSWRRFVHVWENDATTDTADDQVYTIDIMNVTDGQLDGTWNDADYTTVTNYLVAIASAISPHTLSTLVLRHIKAYIMGFNPYTEDKPFAHSGAPEFTLPVNIAGGGNAPMPPQATSSVTEMTPSRRHWGRFYVPTLQNNAYQSGGHVATVTVDAIAQTVHDNYEQLMNAQFFPVVATTSSGGSKGVPGKPTRTLQTVTGIRVDNVGDVIRRRRLKNSTHKVTLPLPAAGQQPA